MGRRCILLDTLGAFAALLPLFLGGGLVLARRSLAERLAAKRDSEPEAPGDLLESLLAVAGVCLIVFGLGARAGTFVGLLRRPEPWLELLQQPRDEWAALVRALVQLVAGLGLALGSEGVAAALRSLRTAGRAPRS